MPLYGMLSAGNPYVLPAVLVAAAAYLGLTLFTDLSVFVRVGVLVGTGIVLPVVLNRLFGGTDPAVLEEEVTDDEGTDATDADDPV